LDDLKVQLFATWASLEADEDEEVAEFAARQLEAFNTLFDNGDLDVESSGIELDEVPDNCGVVTMEALEDA
jgi:hypothetical protein